jgi:hypothetical protein
MPSTQSTVTLVSSTSPSSMPHFIATPSPSTSSQAASSYQQTPKSSRSNASHISSSYNLPWGELVQSNVLRALKNGTRLEPKLRRKVINAVLDHILLVSPNPNRQQLAIVAEMMSTAFPTTFQDRIGEDLIGKGYSDVLNKLCDRRDNLKRQSSSIIKCKRSIESKNMPPQKKKPLDSYGCANWQPILPADCTVLTDKVTEMKQLSRDGCLLSEAIAADMKATYCLQRQLINSATKLHAIKTEFPYLFQSAPLLAHFDELIGLNSVNSMTEAYQSKGKKIFNFLRKNATGTESLSATDVDFAFYPA